MMRPLRMPLIAPLMALAALCLPAAALAQGDGAPPDLEGFWAPVFDMGDPDPKMVAELPADTVIIADSGVAEFPRMEFGGLKLTPQALEHAKSWQPTDDMTLDRVCVPPSIVYSVQGPFPFEVHQTKDLIAFKYEYFDQVRLIFMDGRGHPPADAPHSKMGHSIGHWEGDELVVDTTHIAPSTITNNGLDHTADVHMVERYRLSPDGKKLMAMQWFSDPEVLENNGARWIEWDRRPGQYVFPYECDPSFALEYQQMSEGGKAAEGQ
ncbi:conserved hypothetical protein [Altererythrobacter sp. B11]|uniref:hypothetical protein n=1 Tax=Altererythrobacter sp. B11 TaxID=2060312 RepID=UPI000DC703F0|nr:hypothetical protein [Altererythrobacter sp. B11]BBC72123.1 conserved hypothetical protein [Altererythrobacter sp. B11]